MTKHLKKEIPPFSIFISLRHTIISKCIIFVPDIYNGVMLRYSKLIKCLLFVGLVSFYSCRPSYHLTSVEGSRVLITSNFDSNPDENVNSILLPYKAVVDSIMLPVIGKSSVAMTSRRPESLLSNLISDVLRESAAPYLGHPADLSVMNIGGIRSTLNKGDILYKNVYEILPFENSLCIVYMKGRHLKELMQNIVSVGGEGVSNVRLRATKERKIVDVTVGGAPVDDERVYVIATIDYLAEGNDKLVAFLKAEKKVSFEKATIRQIFLDYITSQTAKGEEVTSRMEGRVVFE